MTWHRSSKVWNTIEIGELERRLISHEDIDILLNFLAAPNDLRYRLILIFTLAFQLLVQIIALLTKLFIELVSLRLKGLHEVINLSL